MSGITHPVIPEAASMSHTHNPNQDNEFHPFTLQLEQAPRGALCLSRTNSNIVRSTDATVAGPHLNGT